MDISFKCVECLEIISDHPSYDVKPFPSIHGFFKFKTSCKNCGKVYEIVIGGFAETKVVEVNLFT